WTAAHEYGMMTFSTLAVMPQRQGAPSCHVRSARRSCCPSNSGSSCRCWSVPAPLRKLWSHAVASSSVLPTTINRPTSKSPPKWAAIGTPSASGANALSPSVSLACKMHPAPAGPGAFPPDELLAVVNLATSKTDEHDQPATRWSLDDLAATIINEAHARAMSRATIWRILEEADLKPHKSVYWLNSHDPDFDAKAQAICRLYLNAPRLYQQGRLLICCDEKTGMQILGRKYPTQPVQPGKPEKREFEYIRYGTRALITSFAVPTGEVVWDLGPTRTSADFGRHIGHVA